MKRAETVGISNGTSEGCMMTVVEHVEKAPAKLRFTIEKTPPTSYACGRLVIAAKIALKFRGRVPTLKELRDEFGMSRRHDTCG